MLAVAKCCLMAILRSDLTPAPPVPDLFSQQPRPGVISENLGIPDIAAEGIDRSMPANVHHLDRLAPRLAAEVRNPARSEWPANWVGSSPARSLCALTIKATD